MRILSAVVALALPAVAVPVASAADAPTTCAAGETPQIAITSGTFDWGIKESFRNYITGPIARGEWKTEGAVQEGVSDSAFRFEVDPEASSVTVDPNGTVTAADIHTKDSTVEFTGHHGALFTNMSSPFVTTAGDSASIGSGYLGYFVEGKGMTEYTEADRTEANKKTGSDSFAEGAAAWSKDGSTLTLKASDLMYKPKPGTYYDKEKKIQHVEGVDVIFMGMYHAGYKPEIDDATVTLQTKRTCVKPKGGATDGDAGATKPGAKDPGAKTPAPHEGQAAGSSFGGVWNIILAIAALGGMFAVLGGALMQSGALSALLP